MERDGKGSEGGNERGVEEMGKGEGRDRKGGRMMKRYLFCGNCVFF